MAIVYLHYIIGEDSPFYVGIGKSEKRAYSYKNRNKYWLEKTNNNEWYYKIIHSNISWEEAIEIEKVKILEYGRFFYEGGSLCNLSLGGDGGKMPQESLEKISKRVYQYTLSNELVSEFYSVREAARVFKIDKESIRRCCVGKRKTSRGFKWSYKKLEKNEK